MMEVPLMSVMSDNKVIWRYNRQARSCFKVGDDVYVSTSFMTNLPFCRWCLIMNVSFNFISTSYFLIT